jgi:hypothetical protein
VEGLVRVLILFFVLLYRLLEPLDEGAFEAIGREAALGQLLLEAFDSHFADVHGGVGKLGHGVGRAKTAMS